MNHTEHPTESQPATQRAALLAAFTCLICLVCLFSFGSTVMERLRFGWAPMSLVYILIPLALTFAILEGSGIHREMKKSVRALFLLGVSTLIFVAVSLILGAVAFLALASMPLSRFHY